MKRHIILTLALPLVSIVLFEGCTSKTEKAVESDALVVDYHNAKEIQFDNFFNLSEAKIVQFEYDDDFILSGDVKVKMTDDYIFVLDITSVQLYRFDRQGKFINKIGSRGSGPHEYNIVKSIQVDNSAGTVDLLCNAGNTIITFDYDGNYIKRFDTPLVTGDFARLNNNLYFFYSGFYGSDYRLHMCDSAGIINSYLPIETKAIDNMENNFTSYGNYGLFREVFFPSIYKIDSTGIEEIIRFDFGEMEVTKEDLENVTDPYKFFEDINKAGFITTHSAHQGKKITGVEILEQDLKGFRLPHFYIDMDDKSYIKVVSDEKNEYLHDLFSNYKIIYIDSNDCVYYLTNPYIMNSVIKENPEMFSEKLEFDEEGNPLILILPIKL